MAFRGVNLNSFRETEIAASLLFFVDQRAEHLVLLVDGF